MSTAHPKRGRERDIDPNTPFDQIPGNILLTTARRLGELGVDSALAAAIRQPQSEAVVRRHLTAIRDELSVQAKRQTDRPHGVRQRPRLLHGRYTPVSQQVKNLWRWNRQYGLGLPTGWDDQLDVPEWPESEPLVSVNVVAFLEAKDGVLGEHRTFDAYWEIIRTQHPNASRWSEVKAEPDRLRLLPGITHVPGVRIEIIDHGANWDKTIGLKPMDVRSPETSPHAGLLASIAQHPKRIRKMNGTIVPFERIAGYQVSVPGDDPWRRVPDFYWYRDERQVDLHADWDDYPNPSYSVPVLRRLPLGSGPR